LYIQANAMMREGTRQTAHLLLIKTHRLMSAITEDREIRSIAKKYHSERAGDLRTEEPLPADYKAFRRELSREATDEDIRIFEEEWTDIYDSYQ